MHENDDKQRVVIKFEVVGTLFVTAAKGGRVVQHFSSQTDCVYIHSTANSVLEHVYHFMLIK